jgi:hypothetical protein
MNAPLQTDPIAAQLVIAVSAPPSHADAPQPRILAEPKAKLRTRHGKIARLPYLERDMVNRMLRNNIPYSQIVGALAEYGIRVTARNVSNWKTRGGYREWCAEQDRALEARLLQDNLIEYLRKNDATELSEVGLQLVATHLSQFFVKPEIRQQLATDPEKHTRTIAILCRLAGQIHQLQKYRDEAAKSLGREHNPERIKREDERQIEITRNIYSAVKLAQTADETDTPHHNYMPKT